MEDNEEEEDDDNYPGHGFPEYDDTTMGDEAEPAMREEAEEEASDEPADDLGRAIADAKRNCASDLEKKKLQRMLEDDLVQCNLSEGNRSRNHTKVRE